MAKSRKANEEGQPAAEPGESVMGYFRRLFLENPAWLRQRSNKRVIQRWLQDHPGETEMPRNVRNTLANLKSSLRRKKRSRKAAVVPTDEVGTRARPQPVRRTPRNLEALEVQIDECLTLARNLDRTGLEDVIKLLRRARNEVVWKLGQ